MILSLLLACTPGVVVLDGDTGVLESDVDTDTDTDTDADTDADADADTDADTDTDTDTDADTSPAGSYSGEMSGIYTYTYTGRDGDEEREECSGEARLTVGQSGELTGTANCYIEAWHRDWEGDLEGEVDGRGSASGDWFADFGRGEVVEVPFDGEAVRDTITLDIDEDWGREYGEFRATIVVTR